MMFRARGKHGEFAAEQLHAFRGAVVGVDPVAVLPLFSGPDVVFGDKVDAGITRIQGNVLVLRCGDKKRALDFTAREVLCVNDAVL